jgi:uncharacterized protein YbcI
MSSTPQAPVGGHDSERHAMLASLSNEMVHIYKDKFGRGPTRARSSFIGADAVVCILEDTFTSAEKNLQALGEHERLREMRIFLQYAAREDFTDAALRVVGREVRGFISGIDTHTDVACELFTFDAAVPNGRDGNER